MVAVGYSLLCEQSGPRDLVDDGVRAEEAGYDWLTVSDHYYPWLDSQGHSPYAWSVLGALAHGTSRAELMSFVTCPTRRYHPAVVAQKASTMGLLSDGRFTLGLGAGENLNEHVVGAWPHVQQRHEMLAEALEIIRALLDGETLTYSGEYFDVPEAYVWDRPEPRVPFAVAASGPQSAELAAEYGDGLISNFADEHVLRLYDEAGGDGKRYGQVAVCYGADEAACRKTVRDQWRWSSYGWKVNADLPGPDSFAHATEFVREEDVAAAVPCGPDVDRHVEAFKRYVDAGFTDVAVVQVGGESQNDFLAWSEQEFLPRVRSL